MAKLKTITIIKIIIYITIAIALFLIFRNWKLLLGFGVLGAALESREKIKEIRRKADAEHKEIDKPVSLSQRIERMRERESRRNNNG
jgi:hypothetical protein